MAILHRFYCSSNSKFSLQNLPESVEIFQCLDRLKMAGKKEEMTQQLLELAGLCMGEVFRIISEFRILRPTFHRKSASK